MVFHYNRTYKTKESDNMEENRYKINELYGVFGSDGTFKIYHYTVLEGTIHCLFENGIAPNTVMREEIKMFSPLVVYDPKDNVKIKSQNWMNGEVFQKDDIYYRAIKLDTVLERILCNNFIIEDKSSISKLESTINEKLKNNIVWYNSIWDDILNGETEKPKIRRINYDK